MIHSLNDVLVGNHRAVFTDCAPEAVQTLFGDQGVLSVNQSDFPVSLFQKMSCQLVGALHVVGHHRAPVIKLIINGNRGDLALHKLNHLLFCEIHAGDQHAVAVPVAGMFEKTGFLTCDVRTDKGDIIS